MVTKMLNDYAATWSVLDDVMSLPMSMQRKIDRIEALRTPTAWQLAQGSLTQEEHDWRLLKITEAIEFAQFRLPDESPSQHPEAGSW